MAITTWVIIFSLVQIFNIGDGDEDETEILYKYNILGSIGNGEWNED